MIGSSAPKPSQTISSAARSGRIASQRRIQATIPATTSPGRTCIADRRRDGCARRLRIIARCLARLPTRARPRRTLIASAPGGRHDRPDRPARRRRVPRRRRALSRRPARGGGRAPGRATGADPALDVAGHAIAAPSSRALVVVPTAAGRGLPDRAAANGVHAFERRAAAIGVAGPGRGRPGRGRRRPRRIRTWRRCSPTPT